MCISRIIYSPNGPDLSVPRCSKEILNSCIFVLGKHATISWATAERFRGEGRDRGDRGDGQETNVEVQQQHPIIRFASFRNHTAWPEPLLRTRRGPADPGPEPQQRDRRDPQLRQRMRPAAGNVRLGLPDPGESLQRVPRGDHSAAAVAAGPVQHVRLQKGREERRTRQVRQYGSTTDGYTPYPTLRRFDSRDQFRTERKQDPVHCPVGICQLPVFQSALCSLSRLERMEIEKLIRKYGKWVTGRCSAPRASVCYENTHNNFRASRDIQPICSVFEIIMQVYYTSRVFTSAGEVQIR